MITEKIILFLLSISCVFYTEFLSAANIAPISPEQSKTTVYLGTGNVSGVYYPLGNAIKEAIEKGIPNLEVEVLSTKGSVDNIQLLDSNEIQLALVQSDTAYNYNNGTERFLMPSEKICGITALYTESIQIVARRDAIIREFRDLRGRRVRTGSAGDGRSNANNILGVAGFSSSDIIEKRLNFAESTESLLDGSIDVAILTAGIPTPAIVDIADKANLISIPKGIAARVQEVYPYYIYTSVPPKTYPGQKENIMTLGVRALLVVRTDMDTELVYRITTAIFENLQILKEKHPAGAHVSLETADVGMSISFHPGAKQYFEENVSHILKYLPNLLALFFCIILLTFLLVHKKFLSPRLRRSVRFRTFSILFCICGLTAIALFFCEQNVNENFQTWLETIWSIIVYLGSGFEDRAPITLFGRIVSVIILLVSVVLGGAIIGEFVTIFMKKEIKMPNDIQKHFLICNWNERGDRVISELHATQASPNTEIVVITERDVNEEELRKSKIYDNVYFVKSDPILHSVLKASKIKSVESIIILADEQSPDPDSKSGMIALAIRSLCKTNKKPHVVAEAMNHRMVRHLRDAGVDEVICSSDYGLGILAQCALHSKLSVIYDDLLTYSGETNEIYIVNEGNYPEFFVGKTFGECANIINSNRHDENPSILLGIRKKDKVVLNPRKNKSKSISKYDLIEKGDSLIVMAFEPPNLRSFTCKKE